MAWGTAFTWSGEWLAGFVADKGLGTPMQVWPGSLLVYVSFGAVFFWVSNGIHLPPAHGERGGHHAEGLTAHRFLR